jgi:hypothetical protein
MDPDISIWQKTGHFYFALTDAAHLHILRRAERQPRQTAFCSLHRLDNNLTTR